MPSMSAMPNTIRSLLTLALGCVLLAGCKVGPDYARPTTLTPDGYRDGPETADAASLADKPWWEVFNDATLVALIDEALQNNYDLRVAVARIEQARAIQVQVKSPLYPQLDYGGDSGRGRNSAGDRASFTNNTTASASNLTLDAFWELDVWGRIRRADESALAQILQAEETRRAVLLTLVSDVAQNYFQLLGLDLRKQVAIKNRDSFGESLRIFQIRATGGVESDLPVLRARASQSDAAATIPQIERDIALVENQINVLLGRFPQPIPRTATIDDEQTPPEVPVGLPSQLLERRPDIRALEARMISANAEIGVAIANYFPQIGLTAFFGRASPDLTVFTSGGGMAWGLAGSFTGPIFQGGRLKAQVAQQRAFWDETIAQYQQSVLVSLQEVSDALISRQKLLEVESEQQIAVTSLNEAVKLSIDRFTAGRAGYFEVLNAQQDLFPAELALADTRTQQLLAYVQLYKALGGGWNLADDGWRSGSPLLEQPADATPNDQAGNEAANEAPATTEPATTAPANGG